MCLVFLFPPSLAPTNTVIANARVQHKCLFTKAVDRRVNFVYFPLFFSLLFSYLTTPRRFFFSFLFL